MTDNSEEILERYYQRGVQHLLNHRRRWFNMEGCDWLFSWDDPKLVDWMKEVIGIGRATLRTDVVQFENDTHYGVYYRASGVKPVLIVFDEVSDISGMSQEEDFIWAKQRIEDKLGSLVMRDIPKFELRDDPGTIRKNGRLVKRHHPVPTTPRRFRP